MLKYAHLLGLDFDIEKQNCYSIIRQFYYDNYGIELSDYACPTNWWNSDLDLYMKLAPEEGFSPVNDHPRDWRPGDLIFMAIRSSTGNHAAVLLDNGNILHHLVGQRSCETAYGGMFRNTTVGVFRHKDVPVLKTPAPSVDVKDLLPPHVRRRLEIRQEALQGPSQDGGEGGGA